jgi:hypothetical protein
MRNPGRRVQAFLAAAALLTVVQAMPVRAMTVDLTSGLGASGTIKGALFIIEGDLTGTGSGSFDAFVRLQTPNANVLVERGYNTSGARHFDQKGGAFTHDIRLSDVPLVVRSGVAYRQFILDSDEQQNGIDDFLSLDALQIYTSPVGNLDPSTFIGGTDLTGTLALGTLRYSMDHDTAGVFTDDSLVLLMIDPGNGQTDMSLYVPEDNFAEASSTDFVYFYTYHGDVDSAPPVGSPAGDYGAGASFEEWGVLVGTTPSGQDPVPEPLTLVGCFLGLGLLGPYLRRRVR